MEMGVQQVPGNLQQYFPHVRRYLPVSSHHVIFNYIDLVMQSVFIKCENVRCGPKKVSKFGRKFYLTKNCPI